MADPALTAALAAETVWLFGAVRIDLAGIGGRAGPLCLLDGAGRLEISGEVYKGSDDVFGSIDSIDAITESDGDEAPELLLTLLVPEAAGAAQIASPAMQGREVRVMVGAMNPHTGLVIGQPEVKFLGEIDVPVLSSSEAGRRVEFSIVSVFERLFEVDEGVRAQDGYHQSIHPGERGLEFMTGVDKNLYWGAKRPAGAYTSRTYQQPRSDNWISRR